MGENETQKARYEWGLLGKRVKDIGRQADKLSLAIRMIAQDIVEWQERYSDIKQTPMKYAQGWKENQSRPKSETTVAVFGFALCGLIIYTASLFA